MPDISVIQKVSGPRPAHDNHLKEIYGFRDVPKRDFYVHRQTGEVFWNISGGLAWPGPNDAPGAVVIVGILKSDEKKPPFAALDEAQANDPYALINKLFLIRLKWGWKPNDEILKGFIGDPEKYASIWTERNVEMRKKKGQGSGFYISHPLDYDKENAFDLYVHTVRSLLKAPSKGSKRLILGSCEVIKNQLNAIPREIGKTSGESFPSVLALGGLVYTLLRTRPWREHIQGQEIIGTVPRRLDPVGYAAAADREAMRLLFGDDEDEGGPEYQDLLPTM